MAMRKRTSWLSKEVVLEQGRVLVYPATKTPIRCVRCNPPYLHVGGDVAEGGGYMGLGGDWKRGPCEGVVIVPVNGGGKGLVDGRGVVLEEDGGM